MSKLDLSAGRAPWAPTRKKVFRFRGVEFYANKGVIHFVDTRTGHVMHCTLNDLRSRLASFQAGIGRPIAPDLYRLIGKLLEEGKMALTQGLHQGDPFCPRARREMMLRRPARISVPGLPAPGWSFNAPPANSPGGLILPR